MTRQWASAHCHFFFPIMKHSYRYEIMDGILDACQAEEMANDLQLPCEEDAAQRWFSEVYAESEWSKGPFPKWSHYVRDIEEDISMFYDYGAGYYFAIRRIEITA